MLPEVEDHRETRGGTLSVNVGNTSIFFKREKSIKGLNSLASELGETSGWNIPFGII